MTQKNDNDFQDWKNALQGKVVSKDFSPEEYQLLTAFREDVLWDSAVEDATKVPQDETQASWDDFKHQFGDELKKLEPKAPVVPINKPPEPKPKKEEGSSFKSPFSVGYSWLPMAASLAAVSISLYTLYNNNKFETNHSFPTRVGNVLVPKGKLQEPVVPPEKNQPAIQLNYSRDKLTALQVQLLEFSITVRRLNAGNKQQYNYRLDDLMILSEQDRLLLKKKFSIDIPFINRQQDLSIKIIPDK